MDLGRGLVRHLFQPADIRLPTVVNARAYAAKILGTIVISNLVAVCFYKQRMRAAARRPERVVEAVNAATAGEGL
jgi:hypothetical protein